MKSVVFLSGILFSQLLFAKIKIEESLFVTKNNEKIFEMIKSRPEFIVDHVSRDGFELYGPKGTAKYLMQNRIPFVFQEIDQNFANSYPTSAEIERELKDLNSKFPNISKLYSIGKSVLGKNLWVMKLSKNANVEDSRPEFKYIANMHGDEIVGREIMTRFIKDCLNSYGKDEDITNLLDKYQIHILVSMNPDGADRKTRANANGIDLNRNFPDFSTSDSIDSTSNREPETKAVMEWQAKHHFSLSANFHGGAEVVNYPWDTIKDPFKDEYEIKSFSLDYAQDAPYIGASTIFENGITNGYAWYEVDGGMQDWSIFYRNDFQITIELSKQKWPSYSQIDYYYNQNRTALIKYVEKLDHLHRR